MLANALPDTFPDELSPYKQAVIEGCRNGIATLEARNDIPHFNEDSQSDVLDAIARIQVKLQSYEIQPTHPDQVSLAHLYELVKKRYPSTRNTSAQVLKRTHEQIVGHIGEQRVFQTQPGSGTYVPPKLTHPLEQPRRSPFVPPSSGPVTATPYATSQADLGATPGVLPHRSVSPWGPASYARELQALAQQGTLSLSQPVADTLAAFAACTDRQQLSRVMPSMPLQGFLGLLSLMRSLNPQAAGDMALYTAMYYIEGGLAMPQAAVPALADALSLAKAWPRDLRFTAALMAHVSLQPALISQAIESLIDRLLQSGS